MVKHIIIDGDWAYLCALIEEHGYKDAQGHFHVSQGLQGTDGQLDVHRFIFERKEGSWSFIGDYAGFAYSAQNADCRLNGDKTINNAQDIMQFLKTENHP